VKFLARKRKFQATYKTKIESKVGRSAFVTSLQINQNIKLKKSKSSDWLRKGVWRKIVWLVLHEQFPKQCSWRIISSMNIVSNLGPKKCTFGFSSRFVYPYCNSNETDTMIYNFLWKVYFLTEFHERTNPFRNVIDFALIKMYFNKFSFLNMRVSLLLQSVLETYIQFLFNTWSPTPCYVPIWRLIWSWSARMQRLKHVYTACISYSKYFSCILYNVVEEWHMLQESFSSSSSSSSCSYQGVGPLVDPFRSHASRSLLNCLPWFLLTFGV
jgi:hypothetical protein